MDPLLEQLEDLRGYTINNSHSISSLAFADDIILLADDRDTAQNLLTHTETYLQNLGMEIAPNKCVPFQIATTKDSWHVIRRRPVPPKRRSDPLISSRHCHTLPRGAHHPVVWARPQAYHQLT
jgi:hypothetical protein